MKKACYNDERIYGGYAMIRLIACDLDETLLDVHKNIPRSNLDAIQKAKDAGIYFVCASGRGYTSMDTILKQLDSYQKANEYTISNNGGIVVENKDFKHICFHHFSFELANALFTYGMSQDVCVAVFTDHDVYAFHLNDDEKQWLMMFKDDAIICEDDTIDFLKDEPIVKILFENQDLRVLQNIAKNMQPLLENKVSHSFSSNRYLELNPIGVDKGTALKQLAAYLHIPMEETMAIGDNDNDISMLKAAGISVAVANASDHVLDIVDYVCEKDHNEGAVAEAIHHYILSK